MIALRATLAYLVILIYIAVVGPIGIVVGGVLRWKSLLYVLGRSGVALALAATGVKYRVQGRENAPAGAAVFCANHESNVDPAVLFLALHQRMHVLYKAELHKFPIMGTIFDLGGFVPVDRASREKSVGSIKRAAQSLRDGNSFLIFPEGTRSRTGQLLPFKKGGFIMAIEAQVPMVPVAIHGGRASMRKGSPWVRPVDVEVHIGQAIPTAGMTLDDRDELIAKVRGEIEAMLERTVKTQGPNPKGQIPSA